MKSSNLTRFFHMTIGDPVNILKVISGRWLDPKKETYLFFQPSMFHIQDQFDHISPIYKQKFFMTMLVICKGDIDTETSLDTFFASTDRNIFHFCYSNSDNMFYCKKKIRIPLLLTSPNYIEFIQNRIILSATHGGLGYIPTNDSGELILKKETNLVKDCQSVINENCIVRLEMGYLRRYHKEDLSIQDQIDISRYEGLTRIVPFGGGYLFFKYNGEHSFICFFNKGIEPKEIREVQWAVLMHYFITFEKDTQIVFLFFSNGRILKLRAESDDIDEYNQIHKMYYLEFKSKLLRIVQVDSKGYYFFHQYLYIFVNRNLDNIMNPCEHVYHLGILNTSLYKQRLLCYSKLLSIEISEGCETKDILTEHLNVRKLLNVVLNSQCENAFLVKSYVSDDGPFYFISIRPGETRILTMKGSDAPYGGNTFPFSLDDGKLEFVIKSCGYYNNSILYQRDDKLYSTKDFKNHDPIFASDIINLACSHFAYAVQWKDSILLYGSNIAPDYNDYLNLKNMSQSKAFFCFNKALREKDLVFVYFKDNNISVVSVYPDDYDIRPSEKEYQDDNVIYVSFINDKYLVIGNRTQSSGKNCLGFVDIFRLDIKKDRSYSINKVTMLSDLGPDAKIVDCYDSSIIIIGSKIIRVFVQDGFIKFERIQPPINGKCLIAATIYDHGKQYLLTSFYDYSSISLILRNNNISIKRGVSRDRELGYILKVSAAEDHFCYVLDLGVIEREPYGGKTEILLNIKDVPDKKNLSQLVISDIAYWNRKIIYLFRYVCNTMNNSQSRIFSSVCTDINTFNPDNGIEDLEKLAVYHSDREQGNRFYLVGYTRRYFYLLFSDKEKVKPLYKESFPLYLTINFIKFLDYRKFCVGTDDSLLRIYEIYNNCPVCVRIRLIHNLLDYSHKYSSNHRSIFFDGTEIMDINDTTASMYNVDQSTTIYVSVSGRIGVLQRKELERDLKKYYDMVLKSLSEDLKVGFNPHTIDMDILFFFFNLSKKKRDRILGKDSQDITNILHYINKNLLDFEHGIYKHF